MTSTPTSSCSAASSASSSSSVAGDTQLAVALAAAAAAAQLQAVSSGNNNNGGSGAIGSGTSGGGGGGTNMGHMTANELAVFTGLIRRYQHELFRWPRGPLSTPSSREAAWQRIADDMSSLGYTRFQNRPMRVIRDDYFGYRKKCVKSKLETARATGQRAHFREWELNLLRVMVDLEELPPCPDYLAELADDLLPSTSSLSSASSSSSSSANPKEDPFTAQLSEQQIERLLGLAASGGIAKFEASSSSSPSSSASSSQNPELPPTNPPGLDDRMMSLFQLVEQARAEEAARARLEADIDYAVRAGSADDGGESTSSSSVEIPAPPPPPVVPPTSALAPSGAQNARKRHRRDEKDGSSSSSSSSLLSAKELLEASKTQTTTPTGAGVEERRLRVESLEWDVERGRREQFQFFVQQQIACEVELQRPDRSGRVRLRFDGRNTHVEHVPKI